MPKSGDKLRSFIINISFTLLFFTCINSLTIFYSLCLDPYILSMSKPSNSNIFISSFASFASFDSFASTRFYGADAVASILY